MPQQQRLDGIRAVVLDTDGVIMDSARVHAAAWKEAFDAFLIEHPPPDPAMRRPFDAQEDYRRFVDGRSRFDGAAAFLASRGLRLPEGTPADPVSAATVWAAANCKEQLFGAVLRQRGISPLPGAVRLLRALRGRGVPSAAVSASRHARELLTGADVLELLETVVDGVDAARLGLPGKPDPALFLEAAARLGPPPSDTAVVEDALAGVEAGRRGGFALVVGVNRSAGRAAAEELRRRGADLVVSDPGELVPG